MRKDKFFVLSMPRSRSFWLSKFLTTDKCRCEHDASIEYHSIQDMLEGDYDGMCDTALALRWRELRGYKVVVIIREYGACLESLEEMGLCDTPALRKIGACIEDAAKSFPHIRYDDLSDESVCRWLFEYLTEEKFDRERWLLMDREILTVSMEDEIHRFQERAANIVSLYGEFL